MNLSFAAIDFETATGYMESACAVGIVTVTDGEITDEYYSLIQPPENEYWRANMLVHGITPGMTESLRISCHLSRSQKSAYKAT